MAGPDLLVWQSENGMDKVFLRNLAEVRYVIEPAAPRLAAERAAAEERKTLKEAYAQVEEHVVHSGTFIAADMQFRFVILSACHNEILEHMDFAIGEALEVSRKVTVETPESSEAHLPLHKAVVGTILHQDADAAELAMRNLIDFARKDIEHFFQEARHILRGRERGAA